MIDISASDHYTGDCRELLAQLPERCVQTCVTSPPYYGLRDYGHDGQIGLEKTPDEYIAALVDVFRGVRRALRDDGTLWVNIGDSYASAAGGYDATGSAGTTSSAVSRKTRSAVLKYQRRQPPDGLKPKDLIGIPWMLAFALRADGWYLRQDIVWHKPNPMPESVTDRCTKSHEYIFLLSKSERYYYDSEAIAERALQPIGDARKTGQGKLDRLRAAGTDNTNGISPSSRLGTNQGSESRNRRSVWTVASQPYSEAHFATFPPKLIEPCILAGSRIGDIVLDPFFGSGTTGHVAEKHGRKWIGFDINAEYARLQAERTAQRSLVLP